MLRRLSCKAAILGGLYFAPFAIAVPLAPDQFVSPLPGTTIAAEPQLAGGTVAENVQSFSGNFTGNNQPYKVSVRDRVVLSIDGTYDFYFTVTTETMPASYPLTLRRRGLTDVTTNVGWRSDGAGTVNPQSASRTLDGSTVQFNFNNGDVAPGVTTRFFFVDTNATTYSLNTTATLDLSPAVGVTAYETFAVYGPGVPEPTALAALSLLGLGRRRRP